MNNPIPFFSDRERDLIIAMLSVQKISYEVEYHEPGTAADQSGIIIKKPNKKM